MEEITNNVDAIISDRVQKELENSFESKCMNCNALNLKTAKFCDQCGQNLDIKNSRGS
ncbi:zinc-ribbon domain-containing protein [Candidatus Nitrosocosmicus agrestis]|jgi:rRNA maturation endonuclease Nob1|nr:zinc-ribbon domain-containing protein [Candidatus Nitrosocosmicus sp. SS]